MTRMRIHCISPFTHVFLLTMAAAATLLPVVEKVSASPPVPNHMRFEPPWRDRGDCGPLSLYLLMRLQDREVSVADVKSVLALDPERGCSLADVARAADMLKFPTEIRFVNPDDVFKLPYPFILHSEGSVQTGVGHFDVVVGFIPTERRYYIIDTTHENLRTQSEESLLRDFTGYVLLPKVRSILIVRRLSSIALVCTGCILALLSVFYPFHKKAINRAKL